MDDQTGEALHHHFPPGVDRHVIWPHRDPCRAELFETISKAGWVWEQLVENPVPGVGEMVVPADWSGIGSRFIEEALDPAYFDALRTGIPLILAESSGMRWCSNTWADLTYRAAGIKGAVDVLLETRTRTAGVLASGIHHARLDRGLAFCSLPLLAMAAEHVGRRGLDQSRLLILDFDAHGGGGTEDSLNRLGLDEVAHLDLSTSAVDLWATDLPHRRYRLWDPAQGPYLDAVAEMLDLARDEIAPSLIVYNAGMDPVDDDVSPAELMQREHMVFSAARTMDADVLWVLAGGYVGWVSREQLAIMHAETAHAAAGHGGLAARIESLDLATQTHRGELCDDTSRPRNRARADPSAPR